MTLFFFSSCSSFPCSSSCSSLFMFLLLCSLLSFSVLSHAFVVFFLPFLILPHVILTPARAVVCAFSSLLLFLFFLHFLVFALTLPVNYSLLLVVPFVLLMFHHAYSLCSCSLSCPFCSFSSSLVLILPFLIPFHVSFLLMFLLIFFILGLACSSLPLFIFSFSLFFVCFFPVPPFSCSSSLCSYSCSR